MKKTIIVLCGIFVLVLTTVIWTQESKKTNKVSMDAQTAKIAKKWKKKNKAPLAVIIAAKLGFPRISSTIHEEHMKEWELSGKTMDSAKLGEPFREWTITLKSLRKFRKGDTIYSLVSETGMWKFPVYFDDKSEIKLLLEVEKMKGEWKVIGLGGGNSPFIEGLNKITQAWPKAKGYNPIVISEYPHHDFFTVPEEDLYNLTVMPALQKELSTYPNLDTVDNIVGWLKPELEEAVRQGQEMQQNMERIEKERVAGQNKKNPFLRRGK